MRLVNLTPHSIRVVTDSGEVEFPPSGYVARVSEECRHVFDVSFEGVWIPVVECEFGRVEVPGYKPSEGESYIVSSVVAGAIEEGRAPEFLITRPVYVPDTSPASAVRDSSGRIVGVKRFRVVKNASYRSWKLEKEALKRVGEV